MKIETERLIITEFDVSMAEDVHKNSLDNDTKKFLPDEVFETLTEAEETVKILINAYNTQDGPFVYPVILNNGTNIGYVQLVSLTAGFEVGYHIAKPYTNNGYATEALKAFLEYIMPLKNIDKVYGICVAENIASIKVLKKCGFKNEYEGIGEYQGNKRNILKYTFTL